MNPLIVIAGANGALAVAFAAFGAHALPAGMSETFIGAYETGADLHLIHTAALAAIALAPRDAGLTRAFYIMLAGVILFSGSLYAYALSAWRPLVFITPVGGLMLMAGWLALGAAGLGRKRER